jgi:hypothetical protein
MPDAVKISELPPLSSVQPGDILPIVDEALTQTFKATAGQIAGIGGGPPGDGMVTTPKLFNGAVTYPKIQPVTADRLLGRATAGTGVVEEIPCTGFMRGVLAAADSAAACSAIGALTSTVDASFTGPAKFADGTAAAPSITNIGDTNTGMFFPAANTIGFSNDGYERLRLGEDGTLYANFPGTSISTELRSAYMGRAWINFDGTGGGSQTIANQHLICQRYVGVWGSLLDDASTRSRIQTLESGYGNTLTFPANYTIGTENRTNYTSPGDNTHFRWNGSAWVSVPASTGSWIGQVVLTSTSPVTVRNAGNVSSVTRSGVGTYIINFSAAMPDATYAVAGTCVTGVVRITSVAASSVQVQAVTLGTTAANPAAFDASQIHLIAIR